MLPEARADPFHELWARTLNLPNETVEKPSFGIFTEKRLLKTKELWALISSVLGFFYSFNASGELRPTGNRVRN
jgi:hypothetical protein